MLCVFWNYEGVIHHEFVPHGTTINSDLYCIQLDRVYAKLSQLYPALVNRKGVLLQQDNARPHTSRQTKEKFKNLDGIGLLPHPPYSPDLAPSDFYLFRSMAYFLKGKKFATFEKKSKQRCRNSSIAILKSGTSRGSCNWRKDGKQH